MNDAPYGRIHVKYDGTTVVKPTYEKMNGKTIIELLLTTGILGFCVLGFNYSTEVFVNIIKKTPLYDYYFESTAMFYIVQAMFSIFAIMLPFAAGLCFIKLVQKDTVILPLDKPKSKTLFFSSLGIAFLALVLSNFLTSLGVLLFEQLGFSFDSSESEVPETISDFLWEVFAVGIVPAVVEEFAMRGVTLQSLRKYGDKFAVIVSAVLFGLMHGNATQAPFAFLLGLVIAWLVIKTESLWTGIAIHLMNNFYAICVTLVGDRCSTGVYVAIVGAINIVGMMLGLFALVMLIDNHREEFRFKRIYKWEPYLFTILSIPMAAAIVITVKNCIETVHYYGFLS